MQVQPIRQEPSTVLRRLGAKKNVVVGVARNFQVALASLLQCMGWQGQEGAWQDFSFNSPFAAPSVPDNSSVNAAMGK